MRHHKASTAGLAGALTLVLAGLHGCRPGDDGPGDPAAARPPRAVETAPAVSSGTPQRAIPATATYSLLGERRPRRAAVSSSDTEVGIRFRSKTRGRVIALRFFKDASNTGRHVGTLWDDSGNALASVRFRDESRSGWQRAALSKPVTVEKGVTYTASYRAPNGRWSVAPRGFRKPVTSGPLRAPRGAGRFARTHRLPTRRHRMSNYYVDVVFRPEAGPTTTPDLGLPLIPWEGGPDYWAQFPRANAGGWADPGFFPIAVWFNGISSDEEAAYDKSVGINTYIGMYEGTDFELFEDNDVFWIGDALNPTFDTTSKQWVGDFLDDEVDGRFPPAEGLAHLQQLLDERQNDGRFKYANFTQTVMSTDLDADIAEAYVNGFTDAVSLDMYFYTIPHCDLSPYRDPYLTPVLQRNCRTASSYGKTMESLRERDAADGELQSLWQFVENLNGGPGEGPFVANITPGQLEGAVMSSVINEARGIVYFNQSLSGPCQGGSIVRMAQVDPSFCGTSQVQAASHVNNLIHDLAPVINTQSYRHDFGAGLDTMLKAYGDHVYVFSMVDGSSEPGSRTLTLPRQVRGRIAEVVGESRSVPVAADGSFQDTFLSESTYHVYRIARLP